MVEGGGERAGLEFILNKRINVVLQCGLVLVSWVLLTLRGRESLQVDISSVSSRWMYTVYLASTHQYIPTSTQHRQYVYKLIKCTQIITTFLIQVSECIISHNLYPDKRNKRQRAFLSEHTGGGETSGQYSTLIHTVMLS